MSQMTVFEAEGVVADEFASRRVRPEMHRWRDGEAVAVVYLTADDCEAIAGALGSRDGWSAVLTVTAEKLRRLNGLVREPEGEQ